MIKPALETAYVLTLLLSVTSGCDDGRPTRVPVSGRVTIDGEPLTSGGVRFFPDGGRPSTGEIDANGRFTLSTFEAGDGCTLGTHTVTVVSVDELNSTTRRWNAPKEYANPGTSGLTQTIEVPTDSLEINLTWGETEGPIIERFYGE